MKKNDKTVSMMAQESSIVMAGTQLAKPIRGEAAQHETGVAFRDDFQHRRRADRAGNLEHDIGDDIAERNAASGPEADRDRRIEMGAGNMPDGIGHRHHGEAESKRDADKTDAQLRIGGGDHRGAAAAKSEPKGAKKFSDRALA